MKTNTPSWVPRLAYACSVAVVGVVLAACGGAGSGGVSTSPGGGASTSPSGGPSADGYPVTIQNCGQTLTFDKPPSRAVLPYHPMAEIFVGLGLGDRAIGRVAFSGGKEPPVLPEQAADFKRIPVVSATIFPPPKEQMLSLRPDFLLAYGDFDYGGKHQGAEGLATLDELKTAGAQVYTVVCPDEAGDYTGETLEATYRTFLDLGKIFGVSDRAEKRVAAMKAQIAEVSQKAGGEPKVKVIAYGSGQGPLNLLGDRNGINTQIIEAAGGENVFADQKPYFEASLEAVAAKQVDAFVIWTDFKEGTHTLDGTKEEQFLFTTYPNMKASKDRRVALTTWTYTNPGWRVAQTVEDIARQLHPDAFK